MSKYMQEIMTRLVDVPMARMFVLASIIFLLFAVLGRIEGKIEPGKVGRIGAIIVGIFLLISGMAMHFNETGALRDKLRENMILTTPTSTRAAPDATGGAMVTVASAMPVGADATDKAKAGVHTETIKVAIKIISGSHGQNCGAKSGNATASVARACDGRTRCDYKIDSAMLEDNSPTCSRNFSVEWKCGDSATVYTVSMPAGTMPGEPLRLVCATQ